MVTLGALLLATVVVPHPRRLVLDRLGIMLRDVYLPEIINGNPTRRP